MAITLALLLTILVLVLPGTLPQKTTDQIDGSQHIASIETLSDAEQLWSDDFVNQSSWTTTPSDRGSLYLNGSLNLEVSFVEKTTPQAVSIARVINLSLESNPLLAIQATVSRGISYGVRFFGISSTGSSFAAWHEGSGLQHRPGTGMIETVEANLALEVYLATGQLPSSGSKITRILFYLEATPGTNGEFSMKIMSLNAVSLRWATLDSMEATGNLRGITIGLEGLPANQSIFQIFLGLDISGTSDLKYTSYFTRGLLVEAQAFTYQTKVTTTYELVVLLPQRVSGFPPFVPQIGSDSSVIVAAEQGEITFFRLNSLTARYAPSPQTSNLDLDSDLVRFFLLDYYLMFVFGIPIVTVVLIVKAFKPEK